jgi:4-hydroxy-3-methylbut-2-en-1-yl diphosphate reductase
MAEMGEVELPTYFVRGADKLESSQRITHFNLHKKAEITTEGWLPDGPIVVGITAGASCPNNLIEETILRVYELRGIKPEQIKAASGRE